MARRKDKRIQESTNEVLDKLDIDIFFGPAGIPLGCKGRTIKDGIKDVRHLGLDAMEIQLIRGVGVPIPNLEVVNEVAEEKQVRLTVHTPYYMDFLGTEEGIERSIETLKWAGEVAHQMGASMVITHVGLYHGRDRDDAMEMAVKKIRKVRDWFKYKEYKVKIGVEPNGKGAVFGTFDEVAALCKRIKRTVPILSIPHIHARCEGCIKKKEDYDPFFQKVKKITKENDFYIIFSGAMHDGVGNLQKLTPIKKGDLKFDYLAEYILDHPDFAYTIISDSPLLEHDALYMKVILERVLLKREAKAARAALKEKG